MKENSFPDYVRTCSVVIVILFSSCVIHAQVSKQPSSTTVRPGDAAIDGSFIKPYKNEWKISVTTPKGESRDMGTWSDELEEVKVDGRTLLKRTQVTKMRNHITSTVNVFDGKTMAPVTGDARDLAGTDFQHRDFHANTVSSVSMSAPPPAEVKTGDNKYEAPVFDFYGGMWGLLLASFPLNPGYSATIPTIGEFDDKFSWLPFHVIQSESVEAGKGKTMQAWHVQADTEQGRMDFWLTKQTPYVIQLWFLDSKGNKWKFEMI